MAHPNPARRPRHQGVMPGETLQRGVMPAISGRGGAAGCPANSGRRVPPRCPGTRPARLAASPARPCRPARLAAGPACRTQPGPPRPHWRNPAHLAWRSRPWRARLSGRRADPASLNRAVQSGRPSQDHPTDPARPHLSPVRHDQVRPGLGAPGAPGGHTGRSVRGLSWKARGPKSRPGHGPAVLQWPGRAPSRGPGRAYRPG